MTDLPIESTNDEEDMPDISPTGSLPLPGEEAPVKNTVDLDAISLEQALLDVEFANGRVIDLTKRLTALSKELRQTTTALQKARLQNRQLQAEAKVLREVRDSRAFRSATTAQRLVRAARARIGR